MITSLRPSRQPLGIPRDFGQNHASVGVPHGRINATRNGIFFMQKFICRLGFVLALIFTGAGLLRAEAAVDGQLTVWHPIAVTFAGPEASERDNAPNPFYDMRLLVTFTGPSNERFVVPGFFDGDGHGGPKGNAWQVRFTPNASGEWKYQASLRTGPGIAIDLDHSAGKEVSLPDSSGTFNVTPLDPKAPGFLKWGRLGYADKHYLKFQDGPYWIRGGTDEPENFLAYNGFENTPPKHKYADHLSDWREGDPDWGDGKGRAIIGVLNYLAREHVNSIYFLTMNIGGDGKDVWPWTSPIDPKGNPANDNFHFDTAKLRQWEIVFAYAQRLGIALHVVFNEAESANKRELDEGELGPERKLYYREMIARFGHHPALQWNLCEEYNLDFDFGPERIRTFADYIREVDPYDHPITVHSAGNPVEALRFTYGDKRFDLTSIQLNQKPIHEVTEAIYRETDKAGRPLPVSLDEFTLDRGQRASHIPVDDAEGQRREKLWPTFLSGGMIEFILEDLLKTDSFKTPQRAKLWQYVWYARRFMEENLPFWEMQPADDLSEGSATIPLGIGKGQKVPLGPQVFAKKGEVYAVFYPTATATGTLDLSDLKGSAELRWFNPRSGEFEGERLPITGGAKHPIGTPPSRPDADWVVLIKQAERSPSASNHFPGKEWESRSPESAGLDGKKLDLFAEHLGGDGCIVRDGALIKTWGKFDANKDWASAAKPLLSMLLLLAVQEGRLKSVDALVKDTGWPLSEKDALMTYRHLANMVSGYSCEEVPGSAWGYNDYAIQLYAKSLEKIFRTSLNDAFNQRLAVLQFEDGEIFGSRHGTGVTASPRDFARIGWLWLNRGKWSEKEIINARLMEEFLRPGVAADLPRTKRKTSDYLTIGSYGGGTDQTPYGPGVYGFNLWFNRRLSSGQLVWPGLPEDSFQANGMWNRDTVTVIPSLRMVAAVRGAAHDKFIPGDSSNGFNQNMALLAQAAGYQPATEQNREAPAVTSISTRGFMDSAHHWYKIKDESRVIQATPNQKQHDPSQVKEIAQNILLFQRDNGGWPKDYDMQAILTDEQKKAIKETHAKQDTSYDNHNIHSQVDYLARAYSMTNIPAWRDACLRGFDFMLASQFASGGFPQRYPNPTGYSAHITFNDGVMIGILNLFKDASDHQPQWSWLDEGRRKKAKEAVDLGVACILRCQIRVDGKRVGWCQQHDENSFEATTARTFELASICPQDTTEIVRFLMRLDRPTEEILSAINQTSEWLDKVKLVGIRTERVPAPVVEFQRHRSEFDVVVIEDSAARPIWARHYEIGTDRPIFAGRDGVKKYSLAEIERERRTGTPWYGYWPESFLKTDYPKWQAELAKPVTAGKQ